MASSFDLDSVLQAHELTKEYALEFWRTIVDLERKNGRPITEEDKVPESWPWEMFFLLTVYFFLLNWGIRKLIVETLFAMRISPINKIANQKRKQMKKQKMDKVRVKFAQAHMEMLNYSVFTFFGIVVMYSQKWIWPHVEWWKNQPEKNFLTRDIIFFYVAYAARYLQAFVSVFLEKKRKDFWEMQIHHLATICLVVLSYQVGYVKIGCIIMVLMDTADPALHTAKQVVYFRDLATGRLQKTFATVGDIIFVIFIIIFTTTRMGLYPFVCYTAIADNAELRGVSVTLENFIKMSTPVEKGMLSLLAILMILQIVWFYYLCVVLYKVFAGKEIDDSRSDSEYSDSEGIDTKKTR